MHNLFRDQKGYVNLHFLSCQNRTCRSYALRLQPPLVMFYVNFSSMLSSLQSLAICSNIHNNIILYMCTTDYFIHYQHMVFMLKSGSIWLGPVDFLFKTNKQAVVGRQFYIRNAVPYMLYYICIYIPHPTQHAGVQMVRQQRAYFR